MLQCSAGIICRKGAHSYSTRIKPRQVIYVNIMYHIDCIVVSVTLGVYIRIRGFLLCVTSVYLTIQERCIRRMQPLQYHTNSGSKNYSDTPPGKLHIIDGDTTDI